MFEFLRRYVTINRRGFDITLPKRIYQELTSRNIDISLVKSKGRPSCVQLTSYRDKKQVYHGTLKAFMGVKGFKNGNVCDFHINNLVKGK